MKQEPRYGTHKTNYTFITSIGKWDIFLRPGEYYFVRDSHLSTGPIVLYIGDNYEPGYIPNLGKIPEDHEVRKYIELHHKLMS